MTSAAQNKVLKEMDLEEFIDCDSVMVAELTGIMTEEDEREMNKAAKARYNSAEGKRWRAQHAKTN